MVVALAVFFLPSLLPNLSPAPLKPGRVSYNPPPGDAIHAPLSDMALLRLTLARANVSFTGLLTGSPTSSVQNGPGINPQSGLRSINQPALRFINDTSYFPQTETTVAVDPANPQHVVGGFNDQKLLFCPVLRLDCFTTSIPASLSGFTVSADGGASLLKGSSIPDLNVSNSLVLSFGDPTVAPSLDGNFFYGSLAVGFFGGFGVMIAKSNPNLFNPNISCVTSISIPTANACWKAVFVFGGTNPFSRFIEDKPVIAVDRSNSPYAGSVYIGWNHLDFLTSISTSFLARCDGNLDSCTMLAGGDLAPVSGGDFFADFTTPVVDGTGNVYVAWCDYGTFSTFGPINCKLRVSPPGGASFASPTTILTFMGSGTMLPKASFTPGFATEQFRTASIPWLAVDTSSKPSRGNLYFTIQACVQGGYYAIKFINALDNPGDCGLSSILFSRSMDGGLTWTFPVTVSQDAVNFQPYITVDPSTGHVFLVHYTTQYDPFNHRVDVVASESTNGGSTFHQFRVTTVSNEPDSDPNMFDYTLGTGGAWSAPQYGDYLGATASGGTLWILFTANYDVEQGTFQTDPFLATLPNQ